MRIRRRANSVCRPPRFWSLTVIVASIGLSTIGGFALSVLPAYLTPASSIALAKTAITDQMEAPYEKNAFAKLTAKGLRIDVVVCYLERPSVQGGIPIMGAGMRLRFEAYPLDASALQNELDIDSMLSDTGLSWLFYTEKSRTASTFGNPVGLMRMESGWPFRGVRCTLRYDSSLRKWVPYSFFSAIAVGAREGFTVEYLPSDIFLPLIPMPLGFLLNSAVVWIALFISICILRRIRRSKRRALGVCEICGYDLRGQNIVGCPECGWNRAVNE